MLHLPRLRKPLSDSGERDKRDGAHDTSAVGHMATLLGVGRELKKAGMWLNALLTRF